jgi:hypothetical protein
VKKKDSELLMKWEYVDFVLFYQEGETLKTGWVLHDETVPNLGQLGMIQSETLKTDWILHDEDTVVFESISEFLNTLGNRGWELVNAVAESTNILDEVDIDVTAYRLFLKRPKHFAPEG